MKLYNYIIVHTKNKFGSDEYKIYKEYFKLFKIPFYEYHVLRTCSGGIVLQKEHNTYYSLNAIKNTINNYKKTPKTVYKGIILTRCVFDDWIALSEYNYDYLGKRNYYIGGDFELCKTLIDTYIEEKNNLKYNEIIR